MTSCCSNNLLIADLSQCSVRYKLDSDISDEMIAICKPDSPPPPNIYQLIEEKEKDLVLAAELGKALLDKNEEISHRREMITLDYTQKLEVTLDQSYQQVFIIRKHSTAQC